MKLSFNYFVKNISIEFYDNHKLHPYSDAMEQCIYYFKRNGIERRFWFFLNRYWKYENLPFKCIVGCTKRVEMCTIISYK